MHPKGALRSSAQSIFGGDPSHTWPHSFGSVYMNLSWATVKDSRVNWYLLYNSGLKASHQCFYYRQTSQRNCFISGFFFFFFCQQNECSCLLVYREVWSDHCGHILMPGENKACDNSILLHECTLRHMKKDDHRKLLPKRDGERATVEMYKQIFSLWKAHAHVLEPRNAIRLALCCWTTSLTDLVPLSFPCLIIYKGRE